MGVLNIQAKLNCPPFFCRKHWGKLWQRSRLWTCLASKVSGVAPPVVPDGAKKASLGISSWGMVGNIQRDLFHSQVSAHTATKIWYFLSSDQNKGILVVFFLIVKLNHPRGSQMHQNGWTTLYFLSNVKNSLPQLMEAIKIWNFIPFIVKNAHFPLWFWVFLLGKRVRLGSGWSFHQPSLFKWNNPEWDAIVS